MHLHTEKVDSFFKDNELSKSQLRQKYLKLNHSEFNSMQSEKRLEVGGNLQQDYLTFLDHQVKLKRQSSQSKDYLDQQLASINKDIAASASSPAYLGKNPISHDRRRQLYYLDKSINNHRSYIRTEGDEAAPTQVDGRRTNQINQIFRQAHKTF